MRVAVIAPPYRPIPPVGYGGIERVIHHFISGLVRGGHEVTLFSVKGSQAPCTMVEVSGDGRGKIPSGITRKSHIISEQPLYEKMREFLRHNRVDVIHDWSFQNLYVLGHENKSPFLISTCIPPAQGQFRPNLVASSAAHADLCGGKTEYVHYGLDFSRWDYSYEKENHIVQIAKIARYKGQHLAITAARKAATSLVLAGNIENKVYFLTRVAPLLAISRNVRYIGEVTDTGKHLRNAKALVQTPMWFDAFPLIILESFASGTPVISLMEGGVPEQIDSGVNGFLCRDLNGLVDAIERIDEIDPKICREHSMQRFSIENMTRDYLRLYERVLDGESW